MDAKRQGVTCTRAGDNCESARSCTTLLALYTGMQHTAVARRANLHGARRALALIDAEAKVCAGSHASTCAASGVSFLGCDLPEDAYVLSTAFGYCLYLTFLQALTQVCAGSTRSKCSVKNTPETLACGSAACGNMLVSVEPLLQQQLLLRPAQATVLVLSSWLCVQGSFESYVPAARLPEAERTAQLEHWPAPARRVFQQRILQLHVAAAHTKLMTVVQREHQLRGGAHRHSVWRCGPSRGGAQLCSSPGEPDAGPHSSLNKQHFGRTPALT